MIALAALTERVHSADEHILRITLSGGIPTTSERTYRFRKGDRITIHWTSEIPVELHLHGYDIKTEVVPGVTATTRFVAKTPGRFPIEEHGGDGDGHGHRKSERRLSLGQTKAAILYIEIYP